MKTDVIITAGGVGSRMKLSIKKQYLEIKGKPVLYHTISVFDKIEAINNIILTVPAEDSGYIKKNFLKKYSFNKKIIVVKGGKTRSHSVYNGLKKVKNAEYVLVHDAVRPAITSRLINKIMNKLKTNIAVIPVIDISETIKVIRKNNFVEKTVDRNRFKIVQTPQGFKYNLLFECYKKNLKKFSKFTDDASFMEKEGYEIKTVKGDKKNIKITTTEDLNKVKDYLALLK